MTGNSCNQIKPITIISVQKETQIIVHFTGQISQRSDRKLERKEAVLGGQRRVLYSTRFVNGKHLPPIRVKIATSFTPFLLCFMLFNFICLCLLWLLL